MLGSNLHNSSGDRLGMVLGSISSAEIALIINNINKFIKIVFTKYLICKLSPFY